MHLTNGLETSWIEESFINVFIFHTFPVMLFGTIFHWHSSGVSKSQFIPSTILLLYFIMEMLGTGGILSSHSSFGICHEIFAFVTLLVLDVPFWRRGHFDRLSSNPSPPLPLPSTWGQRQECQWAAVVPTASLLVNL